ncbi:oligopeptide-binding protein AppA precursor [bacterium BMS3Abin14]|nr:oligopeptide-binding protein AppA precursor [bacterium BMS3Abin14]
MSRLCGKKSVYLFLILLCLFLGSPRLVGAVEVHDGSPADGDWLVRRMPAEPATLNPVTATDVYEGMVNSFIYESLLKRDNRTLELVPFLAQTLDASSDHLSYTFTLRDGLRWGDGMPLTADDVVFTFEIVRDPAVDAPHLRNYYRNLEKVQALDNRTVRFTFSKPYFKSLEMIGGMSIIPRHIFAKGDFNTNPHGRSPIGSGPYKFVKWETGKEIVLSRNEDYWGKKPHLKKIVFKIITDETVALQVLKRGEMDLMGLTPVQWTRQTRRRKFTRKFDKLQYYLPGYSFIGWNMRRPYFSDKRVRRAMTMVLDRESILKNLRYGLGQIVTGNFFYESRDYDKDIKPWPHDPRKAAALMDEAGWTDSDGDGIRDKDGVPFRFEFTIVSGSQFAEQMATILKEELRKVGVDMLIRPLEWALFTEVLDDRSFDAVIMGWSLPVEADPYQVWHSSQAEKGSNFVGFVNQEADEIIEKARTTFDRSTRAGYYRRFHEILHDEQPYTFLFVNKSLVALDKRFENVNVYPLGLDPTEWYVPADLQRYR